MRPKKRVSINPNTVVLLKQIGLGISVFTAVGLLIAAVWYGTRLDMLTIQSVSVEGGETISHEIVKAVVERELVGDYLGIVPRRFVWTYPKKDISSAVSEVSRIHNVVLERRGEGELQVRFDEYVPFALWCESKDSTDCVFIDEEGYAFSQAPSLQGGSLLRFSHNTQQAQIGTTTLQTAAISSATDLAEQLSERGWDIYHVEFDPTGDAFLHIVDGGEFKVSLLEEPEATVSNLQAVLASEEFSHLEPGGFAYVDLRFGNKVFVNENLAPPEIEMASSSEQVHALTATGTTSE